MVRAVRGDERAFGDLVAPLLPGCIRVATAILKTPTDAEDVVLVVLARLWKRLRAHPVPIDQFEDYLRRAVGNEALEHLRSRRRQTDLSLSAGLARHFPRTPLDEILDAEGCHALDQVLELLDPDSRRIVQLHAVDGMTLSQVAAKLTDESGELRSLEWAKKRYQRACRKLRDAAEEVLNRTERRRD